MMSANSSSPSCRDHSPGGHKQLQADVPEPYSCLPPVLSAQEIRAMLLASAPASAPSSGSSSSASTLVASGGVKETELMTACRRGKLANLQFLLGAVMVPTSRSSTASAAAASSSTSPYATISASASASSSASASDIIPCRKARAPTHPDLNVLNAFGFTVLDYALMHNQNGSHGAIIELLLDRGARQGRDIEQEHHMRTSAQTSPQQSFLPQYAAAAESSTSLPGRVRRQPLPVSSPMRPIDSAAFLIARGSSPSASQRRGPRTRPRTLSAASRDPGPVPAHSGAPVLVPVPAAAPTSVSAPASASRPRSSAAEVARQGDQAQCRLQFTPLDPYLCLARSTDTGEALASSISIERSPLIETLISTCTSQDFFDDGRRPVVNTTLTYNADFRKQLEQLYDNPHDLAQTPFDYFKRRFFGNSTDAYRTLQSHNHGKYFYTDSITLLGLCCKSSFFATVHLRSGPGLGSDACASKFGTQTVVIPHLHLLAPDESKSNWQLHESGAFSYRIQSNASANLIMQATLLDQDTSRLIAQYVPDMVEAGLQHTKLLLPFLFLSKCDTRDLSLRKVGWGKSYRCMMGEPEWKKIEWDGGRSLFEAMRDCVIGIFCTHYKLQYMDADGLMLPVEANQIELRFEAASESASFTDSYYDLHSNSGPPAGTSVARLGTTRFPIARVTGMLVHVVACSSAPSSVPVDLYQRLIPRHNEPTLPDVLVLPGNLSLTHRGEPAAVATSKNSYPQRRESFPALLVHALAISVEDHQINSRLTWSSVDHYA